MNQSKSVQDGQSLSYLSTTNKKAVLLNHYRFGHPSFSVLKTMFPSLFERIDVKHFHCDVCEYAKHKRASFPINNKKCSMPFYLIHTDIWGPSTISSTTGSR